MYFDTVKFATVHLSYGVHLNIWWDSITISMDRGHYFLPDLNSFCTLFQYSSGSIFFLDHDKP